jgi:energy-coupling factor transport system substrate-specific component
MQKIELRSNLFRGDRGFWKPLLRQLFYIGAGAGLYFFISWLTLVFNVSGIHNVTLRPAAVIPALFGVLYGPWVGLFAGVLGKTLSDLIAGWGFYWFGSVAYGLIGFIPGLLMMWLKDRSPTRYTAKTIFSGVLGVFVGALFLYTAEAYIGEVSLRDALSSYFLPEFIGNVIVIIILLPLLLLGFAAITRKETL